MADAPINDSAEESPVEESDPIIPPGCGLWFGWLAASMLGGVLGWVLSWQLSFFVPQRLSTFVLGATMGLVLGFMQWLVLRDRLKGAGWWVGASILGWGAGFTAGVNLAQRLGMVEAEFGVVVGVATGLCLGFLQWLVLRQQVTNAGWWVIASTFAWASSLLFYRPGISAVGVLYGILSGIVTGTVLLWLVFRPVPDEA